VSEPRSDVRTTDRGMWWVVAKRDFWVRLRDRGFVISTAITLVVLSIFILLRAYTGDDAPSFRLGIVESGVAGVADVEAAGERRGVEVTTVSYDDPDAA
jgi:ABC-2 type transport system permease protein